MAAVAVLLAIVGGVASPAYADEWRDKQWHLDFLRAPKLHKITQGEGVTVAVVDTGVKGDHPDLAGSVLDGGGIDTYGHGTVMASLIAGHGHGPGKRDGILGLAPKSKVLPVSVDRLADTPLDRLLTAKVMNLSISEGLRLVADDAIKADVVVVAAAGNTTQGDKDVISPANYPGVIAVSGVDENGNFAKESVQGPEVVLAAPAVNIAGAGAGKYGSYSVGTGTSNASALVSATAALIRAKYPDLSANGVINRLIKTADDKGPPGRDPKYGFGVVNPLKALTADIPDIDYNPLIKGTTPSASAAKAEPGTDPTTPGQDWVLPTLGIAAAATTLFITVIAVMLLRRRRRSPNPLPPPHAHPDAPGHPPRDPPPGWRQP